MRRVRVRGLEGEAEASFLLFFNFFFFLKLFIHGRSNREDGPSGSGDHADAT